MNKKIPKTIHYFWFGKKPLPPLAQKCIESWRKYCPDYEIKRWDETNFNIDICDYVREAYQAKKWAYVSDYARFYVLNKFGGIYLDTDVELIKPIDNIVDRGPFFALETEEFDSLNPGIGMATYAENKFYKKIIIDYNNSHYLTKEGVEIKLPVGKRVAKFLIIDGLRNKCGIQKIDDIYIYPKEYFCPLNYFTGELKITQNTVAIHHYAASWLSMQEKRNHKIVQKISRVFGRKAGEKIERIINFPNSIKSKIKKIGIYSTFKYYYSKFK
ncbi:hypothetical protein AYP82_08220 [Lactobacillus crispatus]|uniref:Glycosyl transferase n=1 Tax=Lactobacillus crispatus TaxID=47770 RepID=A0A854PJE6_9LACO|nr:glycosyltransferase [Lactobacillus crispatus]OXC22973.1 hypothetical protein AYP82_08220 [Lactobacillus crispatus]OXC40291.1 hypothetical protein AYP91_10230 [Lactobacillus crispatus]